MAIVQYDVMYRYVHPSTGKPITNTTKDEYGTGDKKDAKYLEDYTLSSTGGSTKMTEDITRENLGTNSKFDMIFLYNGTEEVANYSYSTTRRSTNADKFIKAVGNPWFRVASYGSLNSAMEMASKLVRELGVENVKLSKSVPLGIDVGIE